MIGRSVRRIAGVAFAGLLSLVLAAHVGSPNVLFDGVAGPYPVRVVIRPPEVVPGLAEVVVRSTATDVERVAVRPVFWQVGVKGAPPADDLTPVRGDTQTFTGRLWLMTRGSNSVYVTVSGARGVGTAIVPVASIATGRLALSPALTAILVVLGAALIAGFVTLVRAAAGEALVAPGATLDTGQKRRANTVAAVAVPLLALLVFGGAKWWNAEDDAYNTKRFVAPVINPVVTATPTGRQMRMLIRDTANYRTIYAPFLPDHGKLVHLFLIGDSASNAFGHLHPVRYDPSHVLKFETAVPGLPAGHYHLFADVTLENGLSFTAVDTVTLGPAPASLAPSDSDDSWSTAAAARAAPHARVAIGDGYTVEWNDTDARVDASRPLTLAFTVRDPAGGIATLQPYLGMAAHAVVERTDGSVFIHLHPMGTVSTAAQHAFEALDRGDTSRSGRLTADARASPDMAPMSMSGQLSIPYEFPKAGLYRVWVQVKPRGHVLTGAFDVDVR